MIVYEYPQNKRTELLPLFKEHKYLEAIILGTLLSDLGKVFVDDLDNPKNAMLVRHSRTNMVLFGGFGEGDAAKELVSKIPNKTGIICPNNKWKELVCEHFGDRIKFKPRTKMSSTKLNLEHLKDLMEKIPDGYEVVKITDEIITKFPKKMNEKIIYFCGSVDYFRKHGFGFCILKDDEIIADATTGGLYYEKAFELDIETHPDHRRKGLATVVSAHLISYSLENGYDPRWDAANKPSVELALKLGYTDPEDYEIIILWGD